MSNFTTKTALNIKVEFGSFGTSYGYKGDYAGYKATVTSGSGEEISFSANKMETTLKKVEAFIQDMRRESKNPASRFVGSMN